MGKILLQIIIVLLGCVSLNAQSTCYSVNSNDSLFLCNEGTVSISADKQFSFISPSLENLDSSLCSDDHTAAGIMVTLQNGDIVHIFRLDPGLEGHHVGNNSFLAKRISTDNGQTWSAPVLVYNDPLYDDRNVAGGLIGVDSIVVFFRKYNADFSITVSLNYIVSIDGGNTWSPVYYFNASPGACFSPHKIVPVPTRGFMAVVYSLSFVEVRFSTNGIDWPQNGYRWDYLYSSYAINESYFEYLGNGRLIGLMRDGAPGMDATLYLVTSEDYGLTWTQPVHTNIAAPFFCAAPMLFYDEEHEDLWVVATDRRNYLGDPYYAFQSSAWIYKNKVEDVFYNPSGFQLFYSFERPFPNYHMFYGYPIVTKKADNNYLIVFIESYHKPGGLEQADFYQFEINYHEVLVDATQFVWNTASSDKIVEVESTGMYYVDQYDTIGNWSRDSLFVSFIDYEIPTYYFTADPGQSIQLEVDLLNNTQNLEVLWSNGETNNPMTYTASQSEYIYAFISNGYHSCADTFQIEITSIVLFDDEAPKLENENQDGLTIFPNPVHESTKLSIPNRSNEPLYLQVFDEYGKQLREEYPFYNNSTFNADGLKPGIYMIKLYNQSQTYSAKMVVN
ncbi:MAG: T9SS type A sorting domain-containing protein [Bacteroidales bacterium]|nr:T9SS type A sorting domain-containing protein [Bacteroidales bacterium]MCF8457358.1 T9SS type A sorting domain-containing protein [Bacteroidales bacterium]